MNFDCVMPSASSRISSFSYMSASRLLRTSLRSSATSLCPLAQEYVAERRTDCGAEVHAAHGLSALFDGIDVGTKTMTGHARYRFNCEHVFGRQFMLTLEPVPDILLFDAPVLGHELVDTSRKNRLATLAQGINGLGKDLVRSVQAGRHAGDFTQPALCLQQRPFVLRKQRELYRGQVPKKPTNKPDPETFGGRLTLAMNKAGFNDPQLAAEATELMRSWKLEVSDAGMDQRVVQSARTRITEGGLSKHTLVYARACKVNPYWLAFGIGGMVDEIGDADDGWPFAFPRKLFDELNDHQKSHTGNELLYAIAQHRKGGGLAQDVRGKIHRDAQDEITMRGLEVLKVLGEHGP